MAFGTISALIATGYSYHRLPQAASSFRRARPTRDRATQGAVEPELPFVIIADCPQVFPAALVQCLERLEHFQRQALTAADALQVPPVRLARHADSRFCHGDLAAQRCGLGVRLDDLPRDLVPQADLDEFGLLQP